MRDIRGDLRDRVNFLKDMITAAETDFERHVEQLRAEHDGKLKDLRENLEAVNTLMSVEHRRLNGASAAAEPKAQPAEPRPQPAHAEPVQAQPSHIQPVQAQPAQVQPIQAQPAPAQPAQAHPAQAPARQAPSQMRLADFLMRKLGEFGPLAKDELRRLAVQDGYFPDGRGADQIVQETLTQTVKAGFVRQLPSGAFALPAVTDMIRLRRAG